MKSDDKNGLLTKGHKVGRQSYPCIPLVECPIALFQTPHKEIAELILETCSIYHFLSIKELILMIILNHLHETSPFVSFMMLDDH